MKVRTIILSATAALMLCACGSSRKVANDSTIVSSTTPSQQSGTTATTPPVVQSPVAPDVQQFVSDLDVKIGVGKDSYNLGGKLSMKRDAVVRINLTYMGFIEVATVEFTPQNILIVNRVSREYTRMGYNDWDVLSRNGITFNTIQDMGWQEFYAGQGKKVSDATLDKAIEKMLNANIKGDNKVTVHIGVGKPDTKRQFETTTTVKYSYTEVPAQLLVSKLTSVLK